MKTTLHAPEERITGWNLWFAAVGGEALEQWETVKQLLPQESWNSWAYAIELERTNLERKTTRKAP